MASDTRSHQTVRLGPGRHDGPGDVVCVMELASMLTGGRFTDRPRSVCPTIAAILRAYNDNVDDRRRGDLYRYASESVGTRASFALQLRRARVALAWATARYGLRGGLLRRRPREPEPDSGPDRVAYYVVGAAIGRHRTEDSHGAILSLLDSLIVMGVGDRLVGELVEQLPEGVEHRGGAEQLLVAEVAQRAAEARLDPSPPLLHEGAAAVGQVGQDHAPIALGPDTVNESRSGEALEHLGDARRAEVRMQRELAGGHLAVLAQAEQESVLRVAQPVGVPRLSTAHAADRGHRALERVTELLGRIEAVETRGCVRERLPRLLLHAAIASAIVSAVTGD
jgi:hypothetical protein